MPKNLIQEQLEHIRALAVATGCGATRDIERLSVLDRDVISGNKDLTLELLGCYAVFGMPDNVSDYVDTRLLGEDDLSRLLYFAVKEGAVKSALFFIDQGAAFSWHAGSEARHAVVIAAENNDLDMLSALIKRGANIDIGNRWGDSALTIAVKNDEIAMIDLLVSLGANVNHRDLDRDTPLMHAKSVTAADRLLLAGADIDARSAVQDTALGAACYRNNTALALMLIERGANVDARDREGLTPLMLACGNGNAALIEAVASKSRALDAKNDDGDTALMVCVRKRDLASAKILLKYGADIAYLPAAGHPELYAYKETLILERAARRERVREDTLGL